MICKNCGKEIPDDSKWCLNCGVEVGNVRKKDRLDKSDDKPLFIASKSSWMYAKKIFICFLMMIISVAFGYSAYLSNQTNIVIGTILLFILSIAVIISYIVLAFSYKVIFYKNYVIIKEGIFNTNEKQSPLTKIVGVSVTQSLNGKIFNYGDIYIDKVGSWDIDLNYIKNPQSLKKYLEQLMNDKDYLSSLVQVING
jgi:membrane protein YdbS with pleckstrin-like domain